MNLRSGAPSEGPGLGRESASLADLPNLGPKSQALLAAAGITTLAQLTAMGAVVAFARVRATGANASLNLLWALEGAITGEHWQIVAREHRTSLLLALEQVKPPVTGARPKRIRTSR